jgi:hypothetical protein
MLFAAGVIARVCGSDGLMCANHIAEETQELCHHICRRVYTQRRFNTSGENVLSTTEHKRLLDLQT